MQGKDFSKNKRRKPLSHYKILRCHVRYTDKSHPDSVKPGTLLGFKDKNGVLYPNLDSYLKAREQQEKIKQDEIEKDEEFIL